MTAPELPDDPAVLQARDKILASAREWPFFKLIGMEVVDMRPGWSMLKVAYRHDLTQPAMIMHGGIIATLIDTGIAHAILLTNVHKHDGNTSIVSVDLRVKFFRPVSDGMIYCESTVTRRRPANHPCRKHRSHRRRQRSRPRRFDLYGRNPRPIEEGVSKRRGPK